MIKEKSRTFSESDIKPKGCGNKFYNEKISFFCGKPHLCPSCSPNHSPTGDDKDPDGIQADVLSAIVSTESRTSGSAFVLSDEVWFANGNLLRDCPYNMLTVNKVKEFIRLLKEKGQTVHSCPEGNEDYECHCTNSKIEDQNCWVFNKIEFDKLAGDLK